MAKANSDNAQSRAMVSVDVRREELVARMPQALQQDLAMAELLILRGLVPKQLDTPEKLLMVWQRGRELHIPDSAAVRLIFVTPDGSLGYYASLMQALFQRTGGRVIPGKCDASEANFRFVRRDGTWWEYGLTMEQARTLHYHEQWKWDDWDEQRHRYRKEKGHWEPRDSWHNFPADMLAACAMRKGLRLGGADALIGLAGMVEGNVDDTSLTEYDLGDNEFVSPEEMARREESRARDNAPMSQPHANGLFKTKGKGNGNGTPAPATVQSEEPVEGEYMEVEEGGGETTMETPQEQAATAATAPQPEQAPQPSPEPKATKAGKPWDAGTLRQFRAQTKHLFEKRGMEPDAATVERALGCTPEKCSLPYSEAIKALEALLNAKQEAIL